MKDWIIGWLAEKSTWAGAIALASAFGAVATMVIEAFAGSK